MTVFLFGPEGAQFLFGSLSDHFGRRGEFITRLGLYAASGIVCAEAPSIQLLIVSRMLPTPAGSGPVPPSAPSTRATRRIGTISAPSEGGGQRGQIWPPLRTPDWELGPSEVGKGGACAARSRRGQSQTAMGAARGVEGLGRGRGVRRRGA